MPFETFRSKVHEYCSRMGLTAEVFHDSDKGIHIARLSDGDTIYGNTINRSVYIRDRFHNHNRQYSPV